MPLKINVIAIKTEVSFKQLMQQILENAFYI